MGDDPRLRQRRTVRLKHHAYTGVGAYFITVCTADRQHLFGEIVDGAMRLSAMGAIVHDEWLRTAHVRSTIQAEAAEFVVMPNHIHGILWVTGVLAMPARTQQRRAHTDDGWRADDDAISVTGRPELERFGQPVPGSIPTVVRAFKAVVTRRIHAECALPGAAIWQRNYHEHVIRTRESLRRIQKYIIDNPTRWHDDPWHPR